MPVITTIVLYSQPVPSDGRGIATIAANPRASGSVPQAVDSGWIGAGLQQRGWLEQIQMWALPLWSFGVALFSVRLLCGGAHAFVLRRRGEHADASVLATVDGLATRMGIDRPVRVLISTRIDVPSVLGSLRPVILLPPATAMGLTPQQLEAVLAHELAHVRRHDYLVNILQMIAETLLFYHPVDVVDIASDPPERELCCDDLAVRACGDALCYARALTTLEKMRAPVPGLALGSTGGSAGGPLLYRIQRLLGATTRVDGPSRWPGVLAMCLTLMCAALNVSWVRAQSQTAVRPEFEVASIKPTTFVPGLMGVTFLPGGRLSVDQSPLPLLIASAYGVSMQQLDWPKTVPSIDEFYNIEAKATPNVIPQGPLTRQANQQMALMLQALLADRFKLRRSIASRKELPVFDLLVAKNGPKLKKAADRDCAEAPSTPRPCHSLHGGPAGGFVGKTVSMSDLADNLSLFVGRLVPDSNRSGVKPRMSNRFPMESRREVTPRPPMTRGRPPPDPSVSVRPATLGKYKSRPAGCPEPPNNLTICERQWRTRLQVFIV